MAKHAARFWERPAAYFPWSVTKARTEFAEAVMANDLDLARQLRVRGRAGSKIRAWSDALRPFWKA